MKLIVAVHHHLQLPPPVEGGQGTAAAAAAAAVVAAVAFEAWDDAEATKTFVSRVALAEGDPKKPARGAPDLRELPAVLQLLREHRLEPELIVLADAFVHLDADETPGLGQHLHQELGGTVPVIGVSKKRLPGLTAQYELIREDEAAPLLVTATGIDIGAAKARLRTMHGRKRVPTLVKLAVRLAKGGE